VTSDFIESPAGKEVAGTKRIAERGFFHFLVEFQTSRNGAALKSIILHLPLIATR
jgi:hypothetical protein